MKSTLKHILGLSLLSLAAVFSSANAALAASTTLVVNELITNDTHAQSHEFVEIRNVSTEDVHADLFELRYQGTTSAGAPSATVTTFYTFPVGSVIPAGGYYLVVSSTYAQDPQHEGQAYNGVFPVLFSGTLSTNGAVGLFDAAGNRVDSVGWGTSPTTHPLVETAAAPSFFVGTSIERQAGGDGLFDHDDNSVDFVLNGDPSPTSTPYIPDTPVVSDVVLNPDHADPEMTVELSATVTKTIHDVSAVTVDLTALGGPADASLTNTSGATWSRSITIPAGQAAGPYIVIVRAADTSAKYGTGGATLFVYPGPPRTVADALANAPNTGELLRVRGTVISARTGFAYIADSGAGRSLAVTDGSANNGVLPLEQGQDVTITGRITREDWFSSSDPSKLIYRGELRLETATGSPDDIVFHSEGNTVAAPTPVTLSDVLTDETLVGRLVSISGLTAKGAPAKVAGSTGDNISLVPLNDADSTWIGISRTATDQATLPYPGVSNDFIPATLDTNFYVPWITAGDVFNVTGVVGITSVGINTTTGLVSPKVLRVRGASDFVLTNNAKFMYGQALPASVEQGRSVTLRVVGYPAAFASVTANTSALGGGNVAMTADGTGGYSATVPVPAGTTLGEKTIPVSVNHAGQSATGSITLSVVAPTTHPGDVDNSGGSPNADDVRLILKVAAGLIAATDPAVKWENGDVFPKDVPDKQLTLNDALRVLRAVHGLDDL